MNNEIWKDIPGFGDKYQVSNYGRVRNKLTMIILKPEPHKKGYLYKTLYEKWNGVKKSIPIHRLVADAFILNPMHFNEINHKDENPSNNFVDNLEWCTRKYNVNYGTRNQRAGKTISEVKRGNTFVSDETKAKLAKAALGNTNRRRSILMYDTSGNLLGRFVSSYQAMEATGVNRCNITACCKGRLKRAGNYLWKYASDS